MESTSVLPLLLEILLELLLLLLLLLWELNESRCNDSREEDAMVVCVFVCNVRLLGQRSIRADIFGEHHCFQEVVWLARANDPLSSSLLAGCWLLLVYSSTN
jgi:hypothetical protein